MSVVSSEKELVHLDVCGKNYE